ncbi:enhancer of polycomb homolog 1 isoform X8 [Pituophis catenifer annectens]|uniref:enhancer of polycomb homolog 1 isoform X8 n=1 Tax=Pituophis catenifer annectens TaxID=94852 RepID=UPI0039947D68
MSKLSFRARALDASKPLPVFRCEDLPDLAEYASINRAVPQMPTGMEKEEESEHHLQRAISAQQVYGEKRDNMVIPVPEAESNIAYYESIYPGEFKMPKQLIHIQPFSLDAEQPNYDLDSEDEAFVNKLKKKIDISPLQFEEMIVQLEKGSSQQPISLQEAKLLLKEDDELISEIYEYWIKKRKNCQGPSPISVVKQEKRDGSSTNDPYVAFRRRTEKMQTRKNRKNDEASYEKMLKLRRDLSHAVTILEMIKRREKSKRELLHLTLEIMEKRYNLGDYNGEIMSEVMVHRQPIKPTYAIPVISVPNSTQFKHPESMELKEFKINKPHLEQTGDWPWNSPKGGTLGDERYRYCLTTLTVPQSCIGFSRRRVGRGGRVFLDRAYSENNSPFCQLDSEILSSQLHSSVNQFANTSETNTSDRYFFKDFSQILVNFKSCRWRHFRPRTPSLHDSDEFSYRKLHRSVNQAGTVQPGTQTCSTSMQSKSSSGSAHFVKIQNPKRRKKKKNKTKTKTKRKEKKAFTAEQYQHHQQQLALMQKQQLAQIHQQQASSNSANTSQGFISKTLDSVSAQFAASALVTSEQLMGFKMKDDVVLGIGVNGILQASRLYKGLHFSSTMPTALVHTSSSTAGSALLQPSNITQTLNSHSALSHHVTAANSTTTQVLFGNNIRLTVPSSVATENSINMLSACHIPRTLSAVPSSALKLAAANCQVPASSSVNTVSRGRGRRGYALTQPPEPLKIAQVRGRGCKGCGRAFSEAASKMKAFCDLEQPWIGRRALSTENTALKVRGTWHIPV